MRGDRHAPVVIGFLFVSGACGLAYQTAWMKELRLVFGSSTPATAAVLAIFMGGLGLGALRLGPMADRVPRPIRLYGLLELGIAVSAAASPLLLALARQLYIATGGFAGTPARLLLSALVIGAPATLMGATLPAAARAITPDDDAPRGRLAWAYGVNTLGAVIGTLATTFFLLEHLGQRATILSCAAANAVVGAAAIGLARRMPVTPILAEAKDGTSVDAALSRLVIAAAAVAGFAFLLMELVWYRMLAPILGGSSYTFGLILAGALFGVGTGGIAYARRRSPPSLEAFAVVCALEGALLILPLAAGDTVAILALLLRDLSAVGFIGLVASWSIVVAIVVVPCAAVSGYQFPLLVGLLGRGRAGIGREVGLAYAANTFGAIGGALAGGFGLLPLLGAVGVWRLSAVILALLAVAAAWVSKARLPRACAGALAMAVVLLALLARGPTPVWRHSRIGVGVGQESLEGPNALRDWLHRSRWAIEWEKDGRESSVALSRLSGYAFVVNGRVDGHARADAPTQVMLGVLGAALHPSPKRAMVIGLGTGSTAGWLARFPSIESVDVVELEPAVEEVARACRAVNERVLEQPKVHLTWGDAREVLLLDRRAWDVIVSEPSNPYRAGVASLFTEEFYGAVDRRLAKDGLFLQWLQTYEVDAETVRTVIATVAAVFPSVEVWETKLGGVAGGSDLLLVASRQPIRHDPERLSQVVASEPAARALRDVWGVEGLEGLLTGYVAGPALARSLLEAGTPRSTDDRTRVEYGFARNATRRGVVHAEEIRAVARELGADRLPFVDWSVVEELRVARAVAEGSVPIVPPWMEGDARVRSEARAAYARGDPASALHLWQQQTREPSGRIDLALAAEGLALGRDPDTLVLLELLRSRHPIEADAIHAAYLATAGDAPGAAARLDAAFVAYRDDPWPRPELMDRAVSLAGRIAQADPISGRRLYASLAEPFAARMIESRRLLLRSEIGFAIDFDGLCVRSLLPFEPDPPWTGQMLSARAQCYERARHPLAKRARRDLGLFFEEEPESFGLGISPASEAERALRSASQ